ncbi:MAG: hypothetical protein H7645_01595 [Candidatus Heimdallarchaeota archaeon]|nr:hypothetical protein [Candidatus Heimdallarchaeota archaeon]MCK4769010.1 hypothetical protein [Candidatus Heimdallarchaeota archaeon]
MTARPSSFIGGALLAIGMFGVVITIVQLTNQYWWFLFYIAIGVIGGFGLGSVSRVYKTEEKNAYLVLTGFMLAALILYTVYLAIWQNSHADLNIGVLSGVPVIMIAAASGLLTFIGCMLMSVKPR